MVTFGSNHNKRFACSEALADEVGDSIGEGCIVFVELETVPELSCVVRSWVRQELRARLHRAVVASHISMNALFNHIVYPIINRWQYN
jgi:hypothetical protein